MGWERVNVEKTDIEEEYGSIMVSRHTRAFRPWFGLIYPLHNTNKVSAGSPIG